MRAGRIRIDRNRSEIASAAAIERGISYDGVRRRARSAMRARDREVDVGKSAREEQRVDIRASAGAVESRVDRVAHERAAQVSDVPADARARRAPRDATSQHPSSIVAVLNDDVVELRAGREIDFDRARNERLPFADVTLDDRRPRAGADADDGVRENSPATPGRVVHTSCTGASRATSLGTSTYAPQF